MNVVLSLAGCRKANCGEMPGCLKIFRKIKGRVVSISRKHGIPARVVNKLQNMYFQQEAEKVQKEETKYLDKGAAD
jgi:ketopantoate reductase